jgi:hypothetical protein
MLLKVLPADCPEEITHIDKNNGSQDINRISSFQGFPELSAAELAEVEICAEMIEKISGHKEAQSGK